MGCKTGSTIRTFKADFWWKIRKNINHIVQFLRGRRWLFIYKNYKKQPNNIFDLTLYTGAFVIVITWPSIGSFRDYHNPINQIIKAYKRYKHD